MSAALAELCKGRWPDILRRLGLLSSAALAGRDSHAPFVAAMIGSGSPTRVLAAGSAAAAAWAATGSGSSRRSSASTSRQPRRWSRRWSARSPSPRAARRRTKRQAVRSDEALARGRAPFSPTRRSTDISAPARSSSPRSRRNRSVTLRACFTGHQRSRWPAIVAQITLATGEALGSHMTFVRHDGAGKAPVDRPRLFAAAARRRAAAASGSARPIRATEFIVAEGVEFLLERHAPVRRGSRRRGPVRARNPHVSSCPTKPARCASMPTTTWPGRGLAPPARLPGAGRPRGAKSLCRSRPSPATTRTTFGAGDRSDVNDGASQGAKAAREEKTRQRQGQEASQRQGQEGGRGQSQSRRGRR